MTVSVDIFCVVMSERQSSETALTAAAARAAHLIVDRPPLIFADTLAAALLGDRADELIGYHRMHGSHLVLSTARTQATCRSRYTEDSLADAIGRGVGQYVILGAGLDSFGYRSGLAGQIRVFEVDHPATQRWKAERLTGAGISVPPGVRFAAVDFEAGSLTRDLVRVGFDPSRPALVSWLGVTMYLSETAVGGVLGALSGFAPGTELILDYMLPADLRDEIGTGYVEQVAPIAAERGEPWLAFFAPEEMGALLARHGFGQIRHLTQRDIGGPELWRRSDSLRPASLSVLAHAVAPGVMAGKHRRVRGLRPWSGPGQGLVRGAAGAR
jgi:methyltransferase (TIGR00027 family)